jgi:hypothetical protein
MARQPWDHGTADQAIEFALMHKSAAWTLEREFLAAWREGDLDEWPEYYDWLDAKEALRRTTSAEGEGQ